MELSFNLFIALVYYDKIIGEDAMHIRTYKTTDCIDMAELFFETVHTVNAKDYTKSQLDAWATGNIDLDVWNQSFLAHNTLVMEENSMIVGFGDMDHTGYLDRLYVHKDYQSQGIGTAITAELERKAKQQGIFAFTTHASITAKLFFEKKGYFVIHENKVIRNGVELINFVMKK